jgi:hypothetical protein
MKPITRFACVFLVVSSLVATAHAQSEVQVSTGYNDQPRNGIPYSVGSGQPVPWLGSPNTTLYGNPGSAAAYDPDLDAILLQNLGGSAIDLTAASIGSENLFVLDADYISGPIVLNPGANVILTGIDGSDEFSGVQTVGLTIGGIGYSYSDVTTAQAPDGVLDGAMPWIGINGGAESIPWTPIYTPPGSNSVPDSSSTMLLSSFALAGLAALRRRLAK